MNQTAVIFTAKLKNLAKRIEFMQRKILDKIATKTSKAEVLLAYWDKIAF